MPQPQPPSRIAGPLGLIADGATTIKIGDNNVEYAYWSAARGQRLEPR